MNAARPAWDPANPVATVFESASCERMIAAGTYDDFLLRITAASLDAFATLDY